MKAAQSQLYARETTKVTSFNRKLKDEVGLASYVYAALRRRKNIQRRRFHTAKMAEIRPELTLLRS